LNKLVPAIPETKEKLHGHNKRTLRTSTSIQYAFSDRWNEKNIQDKIKRLQKNAVFYDLQYLNKAN
jgi:hypothetical protein